MYAEVTEAPVARGILWEDERHYELSRSLYRAAAACARRSELSDRERVLLLDACEYAVRRLDESPTSRRCVVRWLFRELRGSYALEDQPVLCATLRRMSALVATRLEAVHRERTRPCAALTRGGSRCRRAAQPLSEFCPTHRHLEAFAPDLAPAAALA